MTTELDRLASLANSQSKIQQQQQTHPQPTRAIDLSRYEAPDVPNLAAGPARDDLEPALNQAYTAMSYLTSRRQHLALLDTHGKNAWLVGNWQLEGELRAVERELAATRREIDLLTIQRQRAQGDAAAEVRGLDDAWRRGVGRVLEAEVAAEGLRRDILCKERERAARMG